MHYLLATISLALAVSLLGGCGQTGPLYLPEQTKPSSGPDVQVDPSHIPPL